MAHLVAPKIYKPTLPVYFNLDDVVGVGPAANNREDVLLVQFAMATMAEHPPEDTSKDFFVAMSAVRATGHVDQATINAIRAFQIEMKKQEPTIVVDGRIHPTAAANDDPDASSVILYLNRSVQQGNLGVWPRIDKIQGCPQEIKGMVVRTVRGVSSE